MLPAGPQEAGLLSPFPAEAWEQQVTDYDPSQIGIVDPELAATVTAQDIVDQVLERREESRRSREGQGLPYDWNRWEDLYYFRWRDPQKESWQSDLCVPEVYNRIRQTLALLRSSLSGPKRFFALLKERKIGEDDAVLRFIADWLELTLESSNYHQASFAVLEEALLLGSGCLKITLEDEIRSRPRVVQRPLYPDPQMAFMMQLQGMQTVAPEINAAPERRRKIMCRKVPLRRAYPDPWAGSSKEFGYFVEDSYAPEETLKERLAAGVYDSLEDLGEPERMREDGTGNPWESRDYQDSTRRRHLITEYTGNIYTRDGKIVAKNWIVTIGNDRALLRLRNNPVWSGRTRYVWCTPVPCEGRVWGRSTVEASAEFQEEMSDLINLMLDDARYSIIPTFAVNVNKAEEPFDATNIHPGKVWRGYSSDFLQKVPFASQLNNIWPLMQQLERLGDKSSPVTEWASGMPTARGRASATEATQKTNAAMGFIGDLAGELEMDYVEPALSTIFEYILQFGDDSGDPRLAELMQEWGGPPALQDDLYRYELLGKTPFKIQVKGISMLAQREQLVPRVMQTIGLMQQLMFPPWDIAPAVYLIIAAQGFSPEQFGLPPSAEDYAAYLQMQMQQQQLGGAAGVGGGVPMGAAPEPPPTGSGAPPSPDATMDQVQAQSAPMPG